MSASARSHGTRLLGRTVIILALALLLGWTEWWLLERHRAVQLLREEQAYGVNCFRIEPERESRFPGDLGWKCYWPGMGPTLVQIDYAHLRGSPLGRALRHFGTLTEINIGQGDPKEINALFKALGRQDDLHSLFIYDVELDDSFCRFLGAYHQVSAVEISPSKISGEQMPLLPRLEYLGLTSAPVSDAGFRRLLALPAINKLLLEGPMITLDGLKEVLRVARAPELISISDTRTYFTAEQAQPILDAYHKKWPKAKLQVD